MPKIVFTPNNKKKIIDSVRKGNHRSTAACSVGITPRTLNNWLAEGRSEGGGAEYRQFHLDLIKAESDFESQIIDSLIETENPKYLLEVLSRRAPDRWAATQKVSLQVTKQIESFMEFLVSSLEDDPETLKKVLEIAASYEPSDGY
jgi:hypothetical protein